MRILKTTHRHMHLCGHFPSYWHLSQLHYARVEPRIFCSGKNIDHLVMLKTTYKHIHLCGNYTKCCTDTFQITGKFLTCIIRESNPGPFATRKKHRLLVYTKTHTSTYNCVEKKLIATPKLSILLPTLTLV